MTLWTLIALPFAPLALYVVGLATGETEPPRWWRRRRTVRRAAARIAAVSQGNEQFCCMDLDCSRSHRSVLCGCGGRLHVEGSPTHAHR